MWETRTRALIAALALVAAACGGGESADTATSTSVTTSVSTSGPTSTHVDSTTTTVPAAFPVTVSASNGAIEISAPPSRIVSLSATHTEMLYAVGAGEQIVAVDAFSNHPEGAPVTELTGFTPNVESIVEFDADLVVMDGDWDGSSAAAMTELGIPVLILPAAVTFDDVYTQIEILGVATGHVPEAAALVAGMQSDIATIVDSLPPGDEPVTFYHELDTTYYSVTSETFIGEVYRVMGLTNIADAVGDGSFGYPQLSEEYIIEQDPDFIFLADTICCAVDAASVAARPGWGDLSAVRDGNIVGLSDDVASRWGPRVVDLMREIAAALTRVDA